jgi:DNA-binding ferritin-like protein
MQGTSDFITELMQEHEKTAWILRAFKKTITRKIN